MPYGEDNNQDQTPTAPVAYGRGQIAAQRFQDYQQRLPIHDALDLAKLQYAQAQLQYQGQQQLHDIQKETNLVRESSAYLAGLPTLQKYLDSQTAAGKTEFQKGGRGYAEVYANYAKEFPTALVHNPKIAADVADNAKVHDTAALMDQGVKTLGQYGLKATSAEVNAEGNPIVRGGMPLDQQALERQSRVQGELAGATYLRDAEIKRQEQENAKAGKEKVPYNPAVTPENLKTEALITASKTELHGLDAAAKRSLTTAGTEPKKNKTYNPQTGELE